MYGQTWRFLNTGKGSAIFNMSLDRAILEAVEKEESPPTFRVYGWEPPGITIGYTQKPEKALDLDRCRCDGVQVAVRPTGGRAVYHDDELAYSVTAPLDDPIVGGSIEGAYRSIGAILCEALVSIGVPAELSPGRPGRGGGITVGKLPCFLSVSRHEIVCGGRKMVGSAQRRLKQAFLQHGSILLGPGQEKIARYLAGKARSGVIEERLAHASSRVNEFVCERYPDTRLREALRDALDRAVGKPSMPGIIAAGEKIRAEYLMDAAVDERYSSAAPVHRGPIP